MLSQLSGLPIQISGQAVDTVRIGIDILSGNLNIRVAEQGLNNVTHILLCQVPYLRS